MKIDLNEYKNISRVIFWSFAINIIAIITLHYKPIEELLLDNFGYI